MRRNDPSIEPACRCRTLGKRKLSFRSKAIFNERSIPTLLCAFGASGEARARPQLNARRIHLYPVHTLIWKLKFFFVSTFSTVDFKISGEKYEGSIECSTCGMFYRGPFLDTVITQINSKSQSQTNPREIRNTEIDNLLNLLSNKH